MYTSSTLALAALELIVHVDASEIPDSFVAIPADIPTSAEVTQVRPSGLPEDWRHFPAPGSLADIGTKWARGRKTAVLTVPSALIPSELNYLLNPLHPDFTRIRVGKPARFEFDPRLFKP